MQQESVHSGRKVSQQVETFSSFKGDFFFLCLKSNKKPLKDFSMKAKVTRLGFGKEDTGNSMKNELEWGHIRFKGDLLHWTIE
jgi:hypothetical protein